MSGRASSPMGANAATFTVLASVFVAAARPVDAAPPSTTRSRRTSNRSAPTARGASAATRSRRPRCCRRCTSGAASSRLWGNATAVEDLLGAIRDSEQDGLDPADFHLAAIERMRRGSAGRSARSWRISTACSPTRWCASPISRASARSIPNGSIRIGTTLATCAAIDPAATLLEAIDSATLRDFIAGLTPSQPFYRRLKEALADYRGIAAKRRLAVDRRRTDAEAGNDGLDAFPPCDAAWRRAVIWRRTPRPAASSMTIRSSRR